MKRSLGLLLVASALAVACGSEPKDPDTRYDETTRKVASPLACSPAGTYSLTLTGEKQSITPHSPYTCSGVLPFTEAATLVVTPTGVAGQWRIRYGSVPQSEWLVTEKNGVIDFRVTKIDFADPSGDAGIDASTDPDSSAPPDGGAPPDSGGTGTPSTVAEPPSEDGSSPSDPAPPSTSSSASPTGTGEPAADAPSPASAASCSTHGRGPTSSLFLGVVTALGVALVRRRRHHR